MQITTQEEFLLSEKEKHDYYKSIVKLASDIKSNLLMLSEKLYFAKKYKIFDENYSWEDLLEEINLSENYIARLIQFYEVFVIEWGVKKEIQGINTKVLQVMKYTNDFTTRNEVLDFVELAKVLSRKDLEKTLKEKKTGKSMRDCKHNDFQIITFKKCNHCGDTIRVYETE